MAYEEPTCVLKMLNDLRAGSRLSSVFEDTKQPTDKPQKLNTVYVSNNEVANKKVKLDTNKVNHSKNSETISSYRKVSEELIQAKAENVSLQEKLTRINLLREEDNLRYENEKNTLERDLNRERCKANELEVSLKHARQKESEVYNQFIECKYNAEEKSHEFYNKIKKLEQENQLLHVELEEIKTGNKQKDCNEQSRTESLNSELILLKNKLEVSEKLANELHTELRERNKELSKLEIEQTKWMLAVKRAQDLEYEKESYLETRAYVEAQSKRLCKYNELEKEINILKGENKKLRSTVSNTLYLESIVDDLRSRQSITDSLQQQVIKLQTENQNLTVELDQFNDLIKHYCDVSDVLDRPPIISLRRRLDELLKKELLSVSEKSELQLSNKHLQEKCKELENKLEKSETLVTSLNESCETYKSNIRRSRKQLHLITWERNDLRNLLDSWQKETTVASTENNQFEILQKVIDNYKQRTEQITNDAMLVNNADFGSDQKLSTLMNEHEEALRKLVILKKENEQLLLKIDYLNDQLEYRTLKGDFDPRNTKIVHMKSNPTSEAVENYEDKLNKAKDEINRLRERVKVLEDGHTQDISRLVEERIQTDCSKEVEGLKERIKSQELQNQRLCEVFKKRSQNFRDAVYMLFGYKLDSLANDRYRILNVYADDPDDILLFQISQSGSGTMEMLETPYSRTLGEMIDLHLNRHNSIPLFLASLTTMLYNKQTMVSST